MLCPGECLGGFSLRGVGVAAASAAELHEGLTEVRQPGLDAVQERPGIRRNGGGHRFALRPQAGQAQGRFRGDRGVGAARRELGGGGAGVDGPAGSVFS